MRKLAGQTRAITGLREGAVSYRRAHWHFTVVREFGDVPQIECRPGQINRVIMILMANAIDAIEGEGAVTVRTSGDGSCISLRVSDTGRGIAPADLQRIFEPCFTTKDVGAG